MTLRTFSTFGLICALLLCAAATADEAADLKKLDDLLLHTKYAEAEKAVAAARAAHPKSADVRCRAALLHAAQGRYEKALEVLAAARKLNFKHMEARARAAQILDLLGRRKEARAAAKAVTDFYSDNRDKITAPREMAAVGLAHALENAPKSALRVLARAQRADKTLPLATLELGRLFALKGQVTDASKEFNSVLRAHPKHPEALAGLAGCAFSIGKLAGAQKYARSALKGAPNMVDAFDLLAAVAIIEENFDGAAARSKQSLAINPNGIPARAILAGCHLVRNERAAYEKEAARIRKLNPTCNTFYTIVGNVCERKRRMTLAESMYRTAIKLNPNAYDAMAALGRHLFRQAKYAEARKLLDQSHRIDGFNVRTYNSLKLLDEMDQYKVIKAGDAVNVRLKGTPDGVLADYVAEYAAREVAILAKRYRYALKQPITVEVLPTQRYFAARVVGLPHIGAIGVCFGNVVALTSPRVQRARVNWRETLRHELAHAVTLLGSDYRVPHWLTEGMAVHEQQSERPYSWDVLLKTSARFNRLIPLGKLTKGFTRPDTAQERMLAYCQSEVVLDFFIKKSGKKCLPELVAAFREGKTLAQAVQAVTGTPLAKFEKECMAYIRAEIAKIPVLPKVTRGDEKFIFDIAAAEPGDAEAQCALALFLLASRKPDQAAKTVEKALRANPKCAEALYIKARIAAAKRQTNAAVKAARAAVKADPNYAPAHHALGEAAVKAGKTDAAARHFRAAIAAHRRFPQPYRALAKIYKDKKQDDKAAVVLEALIKNTSNSFGPCIELARHYVKTKRWKDAARIADVAIGIGPFYSQPHLIAGEALSALGETKRAVKEMEIAALCAHDTLKAMESAYKRLVRYRRTKQAAELRKQIDQARTDTSKNNVRLARAYIKQGRKDLAKTTALAAFDLDPNNAEAKALVIQLRGD
jgi:tetratricopeptide (TPR) repeat protein